MQISSKEDTSLRLQSESLGSLPLSSEERKMVHAEAKRLIKKGDSAGAFDLLKGAKLGELSSNFYTRVIYARIARERRQFFEATKHYSYVANGAKERGESFDRVRLEALFGLAVTKKYEGDIKAMVDYMHQSEQLAKKLSIREFKVYFFIADAYFNMGDQRRAKEYFELAKSKDKGKGGGKRQELLEKRLSKVKTKVAGL